MDMVVFDIDDTVLSSYAVHISCLPFLKKT